MHYEDFISKVEGLIWADDNSKPNKYTSYKNEPSAQIICPVSQTPFVFPSGRFKIQNDALISRNIFYTEYLANNAKEDTLVYIAYILNPSYPIRLNEIVNIHKYTIDCLIQPIEYGILKMDAGVEFFGFIAQKDRQMRTLRQMRDNNELNSKILLEKVLPRVLSVLDKLHNAGFVHGSINLNTILMSGNEEVWLDQCFAAPLGLLQDTFYKDINQLSCHDQGCSFMHKSVDFYALGVTLITALSKDIVEDLTDAALLGKREDSGLMEEIKRIGIESNVIAMIAEGLTNEHIQFRWGYEQTKAMLDGTISQPTFVQNASHIVFAGNNVNSPYELPYLFSKHWDEAKIFLKQDYLFKWVAQSKATAEIGDVLMNIRDGIASDRKTRTISKDDELVIKSSVVLDPYGPIRFKNLTFYLDSLGMLLLYSVERKHEALSKNICDLLYSDILVQCVDIKSKLMPEVLSDVKESIKTASINIKKSAGLYGFERCIYDLNQHLSCRSAVILNKMCISVDDVIRLTQESQDSADMIAVNKSVMTFIASKLSAVKDEVFYGANFINSTDLGRCLELKAISLYASAINCFNITYDTLNLYHALCKGLKKVISLYIKSKTNRKSFIDYIDSISGRANIHMLEKAVLKSNWIRTDPEEYAVAMKRVQRIYEEIESLNKRRVIPESERAGSSFCITISYFISTFTILFSIIKIMG